MGCNVAKTSSGLSSLHRLLWFQVLPTLSHLLLELRSRWVQQLHLFTLRGQGRWRLGLLGAIALLLWNWRLWFAIAVGLGMRVLVYRLQRQHWQPPWAKIRLLLNQVSHTPALAFLSGGLAMGSTYISLCIWRDAPSPWIGAGLLLQGLGTLAVLILLVGLSLNHPSQGRAGQFQKLVLDLTEPDPLKRLVAVRQLSRLVGTTPLNLPQTQQVGEYLQLLLHQESEPLIRKAVLEELQTLQATKKLQLSLEPPLALGGKHSRAVRPMASRVRRS